MLSCSELAGGNGESVRRTQLHHFHLFVKLVTDTILGFSRSLVPVLKGRRLIEQLNPKIIPLRNSLNLILLSVHSAEIPLISSIHCILTKFLLDSFCLSCIPTGVQQCGVLFKRSVSHGFLKINGSRLDGDKGGTLFVTL